MKLQNEAWRYRKRRIREDVKRLIDEFAGQRPPNALTKTGTLNRQLKSSVERLDLTLISDLG
jgi:hypothetical protein